MAKAPLSWTATTVSPTVMPPPADRADISTFIQATLDAAHQGRMVALVLVFHEDAGTAAAARDSAATALQTTLRITPQSRH
jgi:hypothetical protein